MLKINCIILLTVLSLSVFIMNKSFGQLTAIQKTPATIAPGTSFVVKTSINRGNIDGFMKFSQSLPYGYAATEVDSKSGDFRYENNEIKIIWLKAPKEVTYTVIYKINVPKSASGMETLTGKIIYVTSANERKFFDLPPKKITITNTPNIAVTKTNSGIQTTNSGNKKKSAITASKVIPVSSNTTALSSTKNKNYSFRMGGLEAGTVYKRAFETMLPNKTYRVQIGAFRQNPVIKNIPEHSTIVYKDITKHFSGNFATYEEAVQRKNKLIQQGFKDAFIVGFPVKEPVIDTHICENWWHCLSW